MHGACPSHLEERILQNLNDNIINTEAEFKAACVANGSAVLAILRYIQKDLHNQAFASEDQRERTETYYAHKHVSEFISRVENERVAFAPEFN